MSLQMNTVWCETWMRCALLCRRLEKHDSEVCFPVFTLDVTILSKNQKIKTRPIRIGTWRYTHSGWLLTEILRIAKTNYQLEMKNNVQCLIEQAQCTSSWNGSEKLLNEKHRIKNILAGIILHVCVNECTVCIKCECVPWVSHHCSVSTRAYAVTRQVI